MSKIKIQEVIVVEGKDDTANLRRFYEVDTYETRGSAINEDDLERIDKLNKLRGVIVFTDPDYNGERIRKIIMEAVPTAKHAFLNRGEASPKSKTRGRSLGVEHANFEDIQKAARQGASYIGLGPFRFTQTKQKLSPVLGLDGYKHIVGKCADEGIMLPIYAIGGITEEDIPDLMRTGITGIAVSGTIVQAENPIEETQRLLQLVASHIQK